MSFGLREQAGRGERHQLSATVSWERTEVIQSFHHAANVMSFAVFFAPLARDVLRCVLDDHDSTDTWRLLSSSSAPRAAFETNLYVVVVLECNAA